MDRNYYVYLATNKNNTVIYTGVTCNLERRIFEHKNKVHRESFTAKYNVNKVVYAEDFSNINDAIAREKQIKGWVRRRKIELINSINPEWKDIFIE